ncbi:ParA family protein [Cereibacter sphaeroides]|uniref:ParA family protein n=1 Tax=Cereibacter sphaeroides TaxID=1063 RepID=UPI001F311575|nr:ParA family protein [Cereibacter sphaeroides]MCE6967460.1 ParA family protein [Cereibacter sphaeroides]
MPVISFANAKGGSGKTTAALVLACELAEAADVVLIDADPRRPISAWSDLPGRPARLSVVSSGGERSILDEIERAASHAPFVLVDLEGTASRLASYAISQSDLVLVPAQEQHQDAQAALETLAEVKRDSQAVRRAIHAAVLLTRTKVAVKSRTARHISRQLRGHASIKVLETELAERDAFASLFSSGGGVRQLDTAEVNGVDKAVDNAARYASEVITLLREVRT